LNRLCFETKLYFEKIKIEVNSNVSKLLSSYENKTYGIKIEFIQKIKSKLWEFQNWETLDNFENLKIILN
jgi:hypothetical protein